jgi:NhaP-type Na+/H+ or K+/H+ antiporter
MEIFIGAVVSLLAEAIKTKFGTSGWQSRGIVVGLALVGATAYYFLAQTGYLEAVIKVLVIAGAFYAFIIRAFKSE